MNTKLLLAALALVLGLTQPALAAQRGTWGCPAASVAASSTNVTNGAVRIWNFGDGGTLTIRDVRIYDASGLLHPVSYVPVDLGAHEDTIIQVRQLLNLPLTAPPMFGIQVIVYWEATREARPWAEAVRTISSRDPNTGTVTGTVSNDSVACLDLE